MPSMTDAHLAGGGLVAKPDEMMKPELVACRQRLDVHVRDLAVRHADDGAILCTDAGRSQADVVDGPDGLAELEEVADAHGLVEDDGEPADDVLERLLRGQRHGNASDAEACEGGGRIDADVVQHHEHARGDGHRIGEPAPEAQHGGDLGAAGVPERGDRWIARLRRSTAEAARPRPRW